MSQATLEALYAAFNHLDADAMAACYAEDAEFDDEAFSLRGKREVAGMWAMLCSAVKAQGAKDWELRVGPIGPNTAHWEPIYRFSATGRMVHNKIDSQFEFNAQGLIRKQCDRFDFWAWSRQALGAPGLLLGWSGFLRQKVRKQARGNLERFLAKGAGAVKA